MLDVQKNSPDTILYHIPASVNYEPHEQKVNQYGLHDSFASSSDINQSKERSSFEVRHPILRPPH
jgi:hypothetical protein